MLRVLHVDGPELDKNVAEKKGARLRLLQLERGDVARSAGGLTPNARKSLSDAFVGNSVTAMVNLFDHKLSKCRKPLDPVPTD